MTLYVYRCPTHGEVEINKPMAEVSREEYCPACSLAGLLNVELRRVYTPPVTDCHSYGKDQYRGRTPAHLRRATSEDQARVFRDAAREEGARTQFGVGRTTGS